jgi:trimethylamine:corrinoid methyltransferase-like protein
MVKALWPIPHPEPNNQVAWLLFGHAQTQPVQHHLLHGRRPLGQIAALEQITQMQRMLDWMHKRSKWLCDLWAFCLCR